MIELPDASEAARGKLTVALEAQGLVTMVIVLAKKDAGRVPELVGVAEQRNLSRQVIWVQDATLLTPEENQQFTNGGAAVACVRNLQRHVVAFLDRAAAEQSEKIEGAFLVGQRRPGES